MTPRPHRRRLVALRLTLVTTALLAATLASCSDTPPPATLDTGRISDCVPVDSEHSVARRWNDVALSAIRRDFPAPTVHARNLFHLSTVMYDAWTAFDDPGRGWIVDEQVPAADGDLTASREQAISFAAHRLLRHRYRDAVGAAVTLAEFDELLADLCLDNGFTSTAGNAPAAVGNRVAGLTIADTADDGSNENAAYQAPYTPVNPPLPIDESGTTMDDPNRWQPISFTVATSQNGMQLGGGPQVAIGPHWGSVEAFALAAGDEPGLPIDPGPPPLLGPRSGTDDEFKQAAVTVIAASSQLDPLRTGEIDLSPSARGNNDLGTDGGSGHSLNPATGEPYPPKVVSLADWGRVVAEYWADGPSSETPPGHWNSLANAVGDHPDLEHRIGGEGPVVDRLEWDVRTYLALNGALHDAAIAAWGAKAHYDYSRPISMIRYMGAQGQSSDPETTSYDEYGLPLVDGLIEVITDESSAPGERHDHLADHVGEVAVLAWTNPADRDEPAGLGAVDWILAVDWLPYQRDTFVTPAFPGYVSGHSTFSRAAAEVLTAMTGDPFFPGGIGEHSVEAGHLEFEPGPTTDVTLQWATYRDAADEAGQSRIWGGIHVPADDYAGRIMGDAIGRAAWDLAVEVWAG